jgi:hypothetical protein
MRHLLAAAAMLLGAVIIILLVANWLEAHAIAPLQWRDLLLIQPQSRD